MCKRLPAQLSACNKGSERELVLTFEWPWRRWRLVRVGTRWRSHGRVHCVHAVVVRLVRLECWVLLREGGVYRVEVAGLVFSTGGRCGSRVPRRRGRSVALGHGTLAVCRRRWRGRCGRCACRMGCRRRIGSGLYLGWAGLLLEDGVVAKTLALALLAVSTHGMGFVALSRFTLAHVQVRGEVGRGSSLHGGSVNGASSTSLSRTRPPSRH
jgi:hypothetical protein